MQDKPPPVTPGFPGDEATTIADLREVLRQFVADRQWEPFHSPKNLAMSLAIEAAELMEHFQWISIDESRAIADDAARCTTAAEEVADVLAYVLAMADALRIDLAATFHKKLIKNAVKYPVELSKGRHERPNLSQSSKPAP
jgi:NTP pyrophosphatase (non-canonical NTP hydrolase)